MRTVCEGVPLSGYTTLRLGGPAARMIEAGSRDELVAAVRAADSRGEPVLVLGGGSNLVVCDRGFAGTVVRVATRGVTRTLPGGRVPSGREPAGGRVPVTVEAGEDWDALVAWSVAEELSGLECLSGIPGLTGATPIQNVGAYGQEVAETIESVRAYDRERGAVVQIGGAECEFGYRTSLFRQAWAGRPAAAPHASTATAHHSPVNAAQPTGRFVVLAVTFALAASPLSAPVRYPELAGRLGVEAGQQVPLAAARAAVLELRRGKGMVLDPADPDTRSAGSFFTNPVLAEDRFAELVSAAAARGGGPVRVPHFSAGPGQVKVPAAWLIEQAGFGKGYQNGSPARISAKHPLALVNPGGATTAGLIELARQIRDGVRSAFGIELRAEPALVGVTL
ncbi:MAG TPA: UDP-N-acetylmuramate dehydrogenase [Streptosporangiaceae bacterium]